jgi:hypothetical protein
MPAETHSHSEQVTAAAVLELLATAMNGDRAGRSRRSLPGGRSACARR